MSQVKISELAEDLNPTVNDVVPATDVETNTTKKIKLGNFPISTAVTNWVNATFATIASLTAHTSNTSNPHSVTKAQVGLSNVDNTSDADKPVSTAQQTALNAKADTSTVTAHTSNTSNPHSVTKAQVGLGNVDNTSDVDKPISTATQTAINLKADDNAVSGQENAGDYIELDGMRLTMSTSGNRSFGLMTASGSITIEGQSTATNHLGDWKYKTFSGVTVTTSFTYFESTWVLGGIGNVQETIFYNNTNGHFYKATGIVGAGYTPCRLRLERLD